VSASPLSPFPGTLATLDRDGTDPTLIAIDIRALVVRFGAVQAVAGVDLQVPAGQSTALLGRNGAGKSTTMRVLAGVIPPTSGRAVVAGHDVAAEPLAVKRLVGYCPDVGGLTARATPWEHLQLSARLRGIPDWQDRARQLLDRFDLGGVAHRVTGGFSHGMSRRTSVALAAFHEPQVLLLDEPFDGVDPLGVEATFEVIGQALTRGASVVVSTHLRDLAMRACATAIVLRSGAQVATVPSAQLVGEDGDHAYRALLD
jgi:ABC-2 type transport system ATP-binding protein